MLSRRLILIGFTGIMSLLWAVVSSAAQPAGSVSCNFIVPQDGSHNVKASVFRASRQVPAQYVEQMVPSDEGAVVIQAEGPDRCEVHHAANPRLSVRFSRDALKLERTGPAPSCEDLQVMVMCRRG